MAKAKQKAVASVSGAELAEYFANAEKKKSLQRQASDLGKLMEDVEKKAFAYVQANGGSERSVVRCKYTLQIVEEAGSVSWKKEFLKVAGQEKAERLVANAPKKDVLYITPPSE